MTDESLLASLTIMKVICAPDSFKGSITASLAAKAMGRGVESVGGRPDCCPVADGGEGTMDVLLDAKDGDRREVMTLDPLGRDIKAELGWLFEPRMAIVEMALASGLPLLSSTERNPMHTSSFGTGQLIAIAARDFDHVLLAAGGTATIDGGCGILQALGARCLDSYGQPMDDLITGGTLTRISSIEMPLGTPTIEIAADVTVPLLGMQGAAHLFGPQKGADDRAVEQLEANLMHLADVLDPEGRTRLVPGGGAAGGAGFGLHAGLGASIRSGIELVLEVIQFDDRLRDAEMVLVGEGCLDEQTMLGKACGTTASRAKARNVPVIALCGRMGDGWESCLTDQGGPIDRILSLTDLYGEERAQNEPAACLQEAARTALSTT